MSRATVVLRSRKLNRALLARQLLLARSSLDVRRALDQVSVLQAQWSKPPFVALWSRLESFRSDDLVELVHARSVVRATLHRGTLHVTTAEDFRQFRPALQPTLTRALRSVVKSLSPLDEAAVLTTARDHFARRPSTFGDLRKCLVKKHPTLAERSMGYLVRMCLPLILVPDDSPWAWPADATFALAESWTSLAPPVDLAANLRHLVLRYLASFGPASIRDAQAFTGLTGLSTIFASLKAELVILHAEDGTELFDLPDAPRPDADVPAPPRLLAEYDSAILAHHDRTRIVPAAYRARVALPGLRIPATFLVDGFVAGTWSVGPAAKGRLPKTITLEPFGKLSKRTREGLDAEGQSVLDFLASRHAARSPD